MGTENIERAIRRRYSSVRLSAPREPRIAVLHIGPEQTAIAVGNHAEPQVILTLAIGSKATSREYFKHTPATPLELELAIAIVEDEVARARSVIPDNAPLYTSDDTLCEIARLSGVNESSQMALSIEAMERSFDRMASVALGGPASQSGLPASNEFAATLLILREFMHHLQFSVITCVAQN